MTEPPSLEIIPPSEIRFTGPYDGSTVKTQLILKNNHDKAVAFKVKTTTPKRYCVRPNAAMLEAHSSTEITIMLQSFDLSPEEVNRHKFLIQSAYVTETYEPASFWTLLTPENIVEKRLRCVFEGFPELNQQYGDSSTPQMVSTVSAPNESMNGFHTSADKSSLFDSSHKVPNFAEKVTESINEHAAEEKEMAGNDDHLLRERKVLSVGSPAPVKPANRRKLDLISNPVCEVETVGSGREWTTLHAITAILLAFTIGILVCNLVNKYFR